MFAASAQLKPTSSKKNDSVIITTIWFQYIRNNSNNPLSQILGSAIVFTLYENEYYVARIRFFRVNNKWTAAVMISIPLKIVRSYMANDVWNLQVYNWINK